MTRRLPWVIGVAALVVATTGTAVATNGAPVLVGSHNVSTKPTKLVDRRGTPLALIGRAGRAPLSVAGNTTRVPSLNAALLGDLPAGVLQHQRIVFAKAGTYSVFAPPGAHQAVVVAVGAGGGGANAGVDAGGGGSQGASALLWSPVTLGLHWTVTVGAGGAAGDGAEAGTSGGMTAVTVSGASTANVVIELGGGAGGQPGADCPGSSDPPGPGLVHDPTSGAVALDADRGQSGSTSSWAQPCTGADAIPGAGADAGFAGGGGNGGVGVDGGATPAEPGTDGLVMIEFYR